MRKYIIIILCLSGIVLSLISAWLCYSEGDDFLGWIVSAIWALNTLIFYHVEPF